MSSLIDQLPPELLLHVFTHYLADHSTTTRPSRSRTTLLLVCKDWSQLCLHTSPFWARIDSDDSLRLNNLALSRSGTRPLEVELDIKARPRSQPKIPESLSMACEHISRWQGLRLRSDHSTSQLWARLAEPAPVLETLDIFVKSWIYPRSNVFQGQAPKLKHLRLRGLSIPWDSKLLSGLYHLELECLREAEPIPLPSILAACPHLTTLALIHVPISMADSESIPPLPFLHTIRLNLDSSSTTAIVNHIPSNKNMTRVEIQVHERQLNGLLARSSLLVKYISPLLHHHQIGIFLCGASVVMKSNLFDIRLHGTRAENFRKFETFVSTLPQPFTNPTTLCIEDFRSDEELEKVLSSAKVLNVVELDIIGYNGEADVGLAFLFPPEQQPVFAQMTKLTLVTAQVDSLRSFVEGRKDMGIPLTSLVLCNHNGYYTEEHWEQIREMFPEGLVEFR